MFEKFEYFYINNKIKFTILIACTTIVSSGTMYLSYYFCYYFCYKIKNYFKKLIEKRKIRKKIEYNSNIYSLKIINEPIMCCICWYDYNKNDIIRELRCGHKYHKKCIDKWFGLVKKDCPMCRQICYP